MDNITIRHAQDQGRVREPYNPPPIQPMLFAYPKSFPTAPEVVRAVVLSAPTVLLRPFFLIAANTRDTIPAI